MGDTKRKLGRRALLLAVPLPLLAFTVLTAAPAAAQGPQGWIEVCKQAQGPFVSGAYSFTITPAAGPVIHTDPVQVGQCSDAYQVDAGNATVVEDPVANTSVYASWAYPSARVVSRNNATRTIVANVVAGNVNSETAVVFWNQATVGQVKVCKALSANSAALAGKTFTYSLWSNVGGNYNNLTVQAGTAGGQAVCKFYPGTFPIGAKVTVTEQNTNNVKNTNVVINPASSNNGSAPPVAKLIVSGTGPTLATFTNQALGTLQVCKAAADKETALNSFDFVINGDDENPITVPAGECSGPITLPAGSATVEELAKAHFVLTGIMTVPSNRRVTGYKVNPATVLVPFSGPNAGGNETIVTFTNRVARAYFKICKTSSEQSLQNTAFTFPWSVSRPNDVTGQDVLKPGHCSALHGPYPVEDGEGNLTVATTSENAMATVAVNAITLTGEGSFEPGSPNTAARTASFNLGGNDDGVTTVTYNNVRTPPE